ncbi:hypothetical protein RvY_13590 [Ramazzottius varieornatus]|uniref:Uncharacterized protein n=1 Tax=Ramazzottius varieornatus TaxID=947166 RepID=A0A1D1VSF1_RAMVA|nr:hypothetical protein RvY_13590 [Ramazzottius varieornatus]
MFGGMIGAYGPYQMSGLTTGFPMGFPLGPPLGFSLGPSAGTPLLGTLAQPRFTADEWLILQGMTATQPADPSISPGAQAIQPSSLCVPQASSYHASAITNSPVDTGRPDVKINLGSFGPPRKPFDHRRLGNQPPQHCNSNRNRGRGYGGRGGAYGRSDGAVDVAVDVIVTDNGDTAPGTAEEGGPRNGGGGWPPKSHQNLDPSSQADHPPVGTTRFGGRAQVGEEDPRDGQQKPNHTHGPARASNRERRSQSDMEMDE